MKRFLGFLFSASLGALYGLFFAQKSGQKLRTDLKKSANPGKDLLKELKTVATESGKEAAEWAENSAELQTLLDEARNYFDELVEKSKGVSDATAECIGEELAELGEKAAAAAKKVKASATQQATKFKNELEKEVKKEVKTIAKKMKK
jgi:gas vesicle protein